MVYHRLPTRKRRNIIYILTIFVIFSIYVLTNYIYSSCFQLLDNKQMYIHKSRHLLSINKTVAYQMALLQKNITTKTQQGSNIVSQYPKELLTEKQILNGGFILHIIGMLYMFLALAIICDEFFVPSLNVIIHRFNISEDVAGATFMAAGGSAPELFSSIIGVFASKSDVGVGTIVGSAVFNILFVIGMCSFLSVGILYLTWWPLFRDVLFYLISLILLIVVIFDRKIYWYEAALLLSVYVSYVVFMYFNIGIERRVKQLSCLKKLNEKELTRKNSQNKNYQASNSSNNSKNNPAGESHGIKTENKPKTKKRKTKCLSSIQCGRYNYRKGVVHLLLHTMQLTTEDVAIKADRLKNLNKILKKKNIDELKHCMDDEVVKSSHNSLEKYNLESDNKTCIKISTAELDEIDENATNRKKLSEQSNISNVKIKINDKIYLSNDYITPENLESKRTSISKNSSSQQNKSLNEEDADKPLQIVWPPTWKKRFYFILVVPLLVIFKCTLPDVRKKSMEKFFAVTFLFSILWIGAVSYLMIWWATRLGYTFGIPDRIMGLTFLAAGTSIPDLITSVIVARKGYGDMAISSSIGSNIFDITIGLPVPWLLNSIFVEYSTIESTGFGCSIIMLFTMLVSVIVTIALMNWVMTRNMGIVMVCLYVVFLIVTLLFDYKVFKCHLYMT
ncbi:Na(+)/K(+)/Ca(2+)-exchange protein 2 [Intoshia linei]|uniref:Na(+)/K(+)/Ca(2+)-exchange protein 2 n=1 Tax=Intoshia linei TaxID=1819745 RepID=A0A177BA84_9BILA|nr:Na(+)/K(+)/Ca(2+)-exchange protein 2 [Intoshia linei]